MATFIKGVAPISYKPVVFDLDFAYMERMLKMRQNMYNKGASKVKNLYDSLFSSSMLRDDNIAKRDAYLKTISESLKASSGLDFSLDQNVHNATRLFEPINNDPYLVKDIAYTKNLSTEMSKAQRLKSSSNPEDRKQYWAEGIKALQYQAEEFKSASKDQTLNMSTPKYVPNIDIKAMGEKMFAEGKISAKQDIVNGGYIWTMKNGDVVFPITQSMVSTMFSQDPAIKEAFKTQAYVARKDYIKQHAAEFGGDENKAEAAYMEEVIKNTVYKNRLQLIKDDKEVNDLVDEVSSWEKVISQGKLLKGSDDEKKYQAAVEKLKAATEALLQKKIEITTQEINDLGDVDAMRTAVDNAVTMDLYNIRSYDLARYLADKNKELTVKVDPYSMSDYRYNQNVNLKNVQAEINKQLRAIDQANRIATEEAKQKNRLETEEEKQKNRLDAIKARNQGKKTTTKTNTSSSSNTNTNIITPKPGEKAEVSYE